MASPIDQLAESYRHRRAEDEDPDTVVRALHLYYTGESDTSLLDTATLVAAFTAFLMADRLDQNAIPPQLRRAFELAHPGVQIEERYQELRAFTPDSSEVVGFINNLKGKFAEVVICDKLNAREPMGELMLRPGQTCHLTDSINQPGFDLEIFNLDGTLDVQFQVKATEHIRYIHDTLIRYPDYGIITTDEAADTMLHDMVYGGGISDEWLDDQVRGPVDAFLDSPIENVIEMLPLGIPGAMIIVTEGGRVLLGRQTLQAAVQRSVERSIKTGGAGAAAILAVAVGAGPAAIPVSILVRLGVDRALVARGIVKRLDAAIVRIERLRPIAA